MELGPGGEFMKKFVVVAMISLGLVAGLTATLAPVTSALAGKQDGPKPPKPP
jgi:hypothetical protein